MKKKQVKLSTLRSAKGMSQRALAKELHYSPGLIGLYETGKRKPTLQRALEISKYFDTPVDQIKFDSRTMV